MTSTPLEQRIETWPLSRILEYARNPRRNDAAVDRMCASLREFGFKIPCLVRSNGELIDGHLRLKAARSLGVKEIPVILCDEWSAAQVKAFRLLVNRSATWADFDDELVALELQDLEGVEFDLSLTGFDGGEIGGLVATAPSGRGSARGEEGGDLSQAEACATISQSGDLWLCGPHRVLCGDATSGPAVARLLGERRVRLVVTELPTGGDWAAAFALAPGVEAGYVWHDSQFTRKVLDGLLNYLRRGELVYDPFLGNGATLAAAELTGRVCCGMELNPKYVDSIVQRWRTLTGKHATLERGKEVIDAAA